jgi:hypothetical protein
MPARTIVAGIVAAAVSLPLSAPAGPRVPRHPELDSVLGKAAAYVDEFRARLSGIVAEETYAQEVTPGERRELRSDILLVRSSGFPRWLQFRDTFEVDGHQVRARADRLTGLVREPLDDAAARARRIAEESSRYNLGPVLRTVNVPLMPLVFLEADVQERFRFSRAPDRDQPSEVSDHTGHFRVTTEVWVVRFEERSRPTIVRDPVTRRDVPSRGRFWIEPQSGRVLMSEMESRHPDITVRVTVSYQSEPLLGMLVPVAMHETYRNQGSRAIDRSGRRWDSITGIAVYGRFRPFTNRTDHVLQP